MTTPHQARALAEKIIAQLDATMGQGPAILDTQDMYAVARAVLELTADLERAGESLGKIKSDLAGALQAHENTKADLDRANADAGVLLQMAKGFDEDDRDYERINNLAGCENNHWRTQLRNYLADPGSSGAELLAELARLRANQRTAGTVEACGACMGTSDVEWATCGVKICPIRAPKEAQ